MPWDYPTHKARLHSDESYKLHFYAMCRKWLRERIKNDPDYALIYRVKKRIQTRKRRKLAKRAAKKAALLAKKAGNP